MNSNKPPRIWLWISLTFQWSFLYPAVGRRLNQMFLNNSLCYENVTVFSNSCICEKRSRSPKPFNPREKKNCSRSKKVSRQVSWADAKAFAPTEIRLASLEHFFTILALNLDSTNGCCVQFRKVAVRLCCLQFRWPALMNNTPTHNCKIINYCILRGTSII